MLFNAIGCRFLKSLIVILQEGITSMGSSTSHTTCGMLNHPGQLLEICPTKFKWSDKEDQAKIQTQPYFHSSSSGIYTRVKSYLKWIKRHVKDGGCGKKKKKSSKKCKSKCKKCVKKCKSNCNKKYKKKSKKIKKKKSKCRKNCTKKCKK